MDNSLDIFFWTLFFYTERKFKEAQKYSDEIKALTAEGKAKQGKVCQLDEAIKQRQPEAEKLEGLVKQVEKDFQKQEIKYGRLKNIFLECLF